MGTAKQVKGSPLSKRQQDESFTFQVGGRDILVSRAAAQSERLVNKLEASAEEERRQVERAPEAKYAVEVMFGKGFRLHEPVVGAVSIWGCGPLGGRGQNKLYFCPGAKCGELLPLDAVTNDQAICPACGSIWKSRQITGEYFARMTVKKWAEKVASILRQVSMQADLCVKYNMDDLRVMTAQDISKQARGELIENALANVKGYRFPMMGLLQDVQAGADLVTCIHHRLTP